MWKLKSLWRTFYVVNLCYCTFSSQVAYKKRERAQKRKEMEVTIVVNIFDTVSRFFWHIEQFFTNVRVYQTKAIVCWWKHFLGSDEGQPVEHLDGSRDSNKVDLSQWSNQPNKFTIFKSYHPVWNEMMSQTWYFENFTNQVWESRRPVSAEQVNQPEQLWEEQHLPLVCQNRTRATLVLVCTSKGTNKS